MPGPVAGYFDALRRLLDILEGEEGEAIERAARAVAETVGAGGMVHVFGSGHSMLAAIESTVRAGGLAAVGLVHDPALNPAEPHRVSAVERLHGYAETALSLADLRRGEVLVVVSNSGINPVPVEIATGAQRRGLTVVAVTSVVHSSRASARHESGRRLYEVADIVIDTHAPHGDTTVSAGGVGIGAVSTILACAAIHAATIRAVELISAAGGEAPVLVSQNVDGGDDHNTSLFDRYRHRVGRR